MNRISIPAMEQSPAASRPLLQAVAQQLGSIPNLFRVAGLSPAALEGMLNLSGALGKGALDPRTRERIALAVAQVNQCAYCLSAHTYLGRHFAGLDETEMDANRFGGSSDPKAKAAVQFAMQVARQRGHVSDGELDAVRRAGYDDAEVVEIVMHVALNSLTNYLNEVARTPIDFPAVSLVKAA